MRIPTPVLGLLVPLSLAGCRRDPPEAGDTGTAATAALAVQADRSEVIPTVVALTVEAEAGLDAWDAITVEVALDGEAVRTLACTPAGDGACTARAWGLKPSRTYTFTPLGEAGGETVRGTPATVDTGAVPSALVDLTVEGGDAMAAGGGWYVTALVSSPSTPVILDSDGEIVWWYTGDPDTESIISRVIVSADGESVIYLNFPTRTENQYAEHDLVRVSIDGTEESRVSLPMPHHDFCELPDGTLAVIAYDRIEIDGEDVDGDRVLEVAPDGSWTIGWSLWDELDYDPELAAELEGTGWSHANAIDCLPDGSGYDVSLSNLHSIWRISRDTGRSREIVGGAGSAWTDADDGDEVLFDRIHQFDFTDEGVLVFDNGTTDQLDSHVTYWELGADGTATLAWDHHQEPPLFVGSLGDASFLPDGNRLITWSTAGTLQAVDASGAELWSVQTDVGAAFGYVTRVESLD